MSDKSRNEQETILLEERIEKIRKKNEEIKKRHLEVEADKQNAAKLNALVQVTVPLEDWKPVGGRSSLPLPPRSPATSKPRRSSEPYRSSHQDNSSSAKTYSFGEGDGPPPDPKYKFLADSERDSDRRQHRPHRGRGPGRGVPRDRIDHYRLQQKPHPEYEAWRAERIRIDNDRINRQKTAEGQWRREWDHEKITQEEDERMPAQAPRGGGPRRNNNRSANFNQHANQEYNPPKENLRSPKFERSRGGRTSHGFGTAGVSRGNLRGCQVDEVFADNMNKTEGSAGRNVVSFGESLKISVPNDTTPVVRRVKVNAPVVGGTGRVGPRQKIRVSYSSQSEDEAPCSRTVEVHSARVNIVSDSSTKPPLPPSSAHKPEVPKPKRQRVKRLEQRSHKEREVSDNSDEKGNESGGEDSWEDVTTTSGTESACEELSPRSKSDNLDNVNDSNMEQSVTVNGSVTKADLKNEDSVTTNEVLQE